MDTSEEIYEKRRIAHLTEYGIYSPLDDAGLARIAHLTANIFSAPVAFISLVEEKRLLFAARVGINVWEADRDTSFCTRTIQGPDVMVVLDALEDATFKDNPFVLNKPHVRFYAGVPLVTPTGFAIGTLSIVDAVPRRTFSDDDKANLRDLASLTLERLETRRLEIARQAGRSQFLAIANTSPHSIACVDDAGTITFWNAAAERMLGHEADRIIGHNVRLLAQAEVIARLKVLALAQKSLSEGRTIEFNATAADARIVPIEASALMWIEQGRPSFAAIMHDVSDRHKNDERLFLLAHNDPLTGLANRISLTSSLRRALNDEKDVCVMMVDLDGFKEVNDSIGHAGGDAVLVQVAQKLRACVRATDVVARMGGDEFALVLRGASSVSSSAQTADEIINALRTIASIDGEAVDISGSIGLAMSPMHGDTAPLLLSNADLALYQAKLEGKSRAVVFSPALRAATAARRALRLELARAYRLGEFEMFYQPQVNLADATFRGAEALLRWRHPTRGLLRPVDFITELENSEWAAHVGGWALATACQQAAAWRSAYCADFRISVNVFGAQFTNGALIQTVTDTLAESGLPPSALELEITENIILRHDVLVLGPLTELRRRGVGLAFDDYGTGYASLSMLKEYPITRLKIDQTFVRAMVTSQPDAAIIRAVLFLGNSFGMEVIAEGVETQEQSDLLKNDGCTQAQGYLFGKPMTAAEFSARLAEQPTIPSSDLHRETAASQFPIRSGGP